VWLLYKNFKLKWLSKKLDYIKIGLFKIVEKMLKIIYRLNLPVKINFYLVQYIIILKLVYRYLKLLIYKIDIYKRQEEDK